MPEYGLMSTLAAYLKLVFSSKDTAIGTYISSKQDSLVLQQLNQRILLYSVS